MALAYRSHFIFINRPLINSKGENTSATYGFTSALLKLIEDHKIEYIAVVFDVLDEGGTFRDEVYAEYKANRDPPPDELIENLPRIKEVVDAFDIPVFELGGVEADDVIGTLARRGEQEGADVVIVSPDKDFQQLLSERITIFRPAYRGEDFDPVTLESFRAKWGVEPAQFIDIQALWGDSTDNVPGVPGIGEKTAAKLIQEYGSVENLLEHADEVGGKRAREGLQQFADQARMSRELVAIKTDLDIDFDWKRLHNGNPSYSRIQKTFKALEFNTLWNRTQRILRLDSKGSPQQSLFGDDDTEESEVVELDRAELDFGLVPSIDKVERLVDRLRSTSEVGVSVILADEDNAVSTAIVGVAIGSGSHARYVAFPLPDGTPDARVLDALRPLLENEAQKVGHNLKPGLVALARVGIKVGGPLFDTMVAHYLCTPEQPHGIEAVARGMIGVTVTSTSELLGSGRTRRDIADVPASEMASAACEQAYTALQLLKPLREQLATDHLEEVANRIELPLIRVLAKVEINGIRVDTEILSEISDGMREQIDELERNIYAAADCEFNIGSPAQLAEILFDRLGLPVLSKTSTGKPSTKELVLSELASQHDLPALILDWRELSKLKSTYVDVLPTLVNPETGRIHTSYNQTVAATGRLSSQNPNLQNIPVRTARGREIRRAFVPEPGWSLLAADYVQIELRILASMSGDPGLRDAFEQGLDVHTSTAARMFGIEPDDVTRAQRNRAKEVNYGIPYGMSAFGLAQRLRTSRAEAQELIDGYRQSYRQVAGFLSRQADLVREKGYAETLLGRRRYVPDINARNSVQRAAAERIAFNMPMQGTQADMIKLAMIAIQTRIESEGLVSRMLLQVHDELVLESPPDELEVLSEIVRTEMIGAIPLEVPIEVGISHARNWLDAHQ